MKWYLAALKKYAVFRGRARRKEYWYFILFNLIITFVFGFIDNLAGTFNPETGVGLMGGIYSLAVLLPSIGLTVRRLHDTDRSGWWIFISLIPLIGAIVLLVFMVIDGTSGENRFGANPKLESI